MIVRNTRFMQSLEISRQQKLSQDIATGQTQISTKKRLLSPSDDPLAAARISSIGRQQGNESAWSGNIKAASALSARADTALSSVSTALDRAKELMLSAGSDTLSDDDRSSIAIELRSIASELQSLSDSKDANGAALFSDGPALSIPVGAGLSVTPVDSREQVFESVVTSSGTTDIVSIVNAAADALGVTDPAARKAATGASLDALDAASEHIHQSQGEHGLRAARLDSLDNRFEDNAIKLTEERSNLEDTDVSEAIARIQSSQVSLQASQAIYAKLNQQSLFDLLR